MVSIRILTYNGISQYFSNFLDLGNDEFLHAITLKKEDLPVDEGGGGLYAPSPAACETECFVREKHCDAWNFIFDDDSGNTLYT